MDVLFNMLEVIAVVEHFLGVDEDEDKEDDTHSVYNDILSKFDKYDI